MHASQTDRWRFRVISTLVVGAAFSLGFITAYGIQLGDESKTFAVREYDQRFEFIRPLLICQLNEEEEAREFRSLESKIQRLITDAERAGKITTASVYFRSGGGRWMGINEDQEYAPASLLKVPIMMTYLKKAEEDPGILEKKYDYVRTYEEDPLVPEPILVSDRSYSVYDLIRGMIIQSDNSATDMLEMNADRADLDNAYEVLGIKDPYSSEEDPYRISAKQYGLFFRVLYNSTFLNREMSNKALELLSQAEYDLGLRAGTPTNIKIAHKHGVRGLTMDDGSHGVEVSDCGIIYNPSSPYLLCVMTHGKNAFVLSDVIKAVAETVYQSVATEDN